MNLDEIRELIQLVADTGIAELEVQRGEDRVRIRRGFHRTVREIDARPELAAEAAAAASAPERPVSRPESKVLERAETEQALESEDLVVVKSPIVGTFYESGSPGSPAFVRVGDTVQPGQVLCIIESMKLMNEIESEIAGVIVSKLASNAQPVEYGEALFTLRPL